jgi:serine/threonine protein kinase
VFLAKHTKDQMLYALKVENKKQLMSKKQLKYAVMEANILKKLDHPFIIKLYYSFQTQFNLYLVLDYCPYGNILAVLN